MSTSKDVVRMQIVAERLQDKCRVAPIKTEGT